MIVAIFGMLIFYVCHLRGGRGRAGAGRRGKTVSIVVRVVYNYKEEGAGREPVGGRRRGSWKSRLNII